MANFARGECQWQRDEDGEIVLKNNKPILNVKKHALRTGRSSYIRNSLKHFAFEG